VLLPDQPYRLLLIPQRCDMTDMNLVGVITGSVFAVAALVPFVFSALKGKLRSKR
jgi:hypothetical protein